MPRLPTECTATCCLSTSLHLPVGHCRTFEAAIAPSAACVGTLSCARQRTRRIPVGAAWVPGCEWQLKFATLARRYGDIDFLHYAWGALMQNQFKPHPTSLFNGQPVLEYYYLHGAHPLSVLHDIYCRSYRTACPSPA